MRKIVPVVSKKELAAFIDFPHDLYKDDQNYVPELFIAKLTTKRARVNRGTGRSGVQSADSGVPRLQKLKPSRFS